MGFFPGGNGTKLQVSVRRRAAISSSMALRQGGEERASEIVLGTGAATWEMTTVLSSSGGVPEDKGT